MTKISIITGATSGIGYEMAKLIAREETDILLIARSEENLKKVQQELAHISHCDISYFAYDLAKNFAPLQQQIARQINGKRLLYQITP